MLTLAELEDYLDRYFESAGITFDIWIEQFGRGLYRSRNEVIVSLLAPLQPKRIFEFACAGGFLAEMTMEAIPSIERYTCSNFSHRMVQHCGKQLSAFDKCRVELVDANVAVSNDMGREKLAAYDAFVTTSFEHIEHDRDLIENFPSGSIFVFSVAKFDDPEHYRVFSDAAEIVNRYADLLDFRKIVTVENQKMVALARTR